MTTDDSWDAAPEEVFDKFVRSQEFVDTGASKIISPWPLRESSAEVYGFMFSRYINWLNKNNISLTRITDAAISSFLDEVNSTTASEIRWRYLRLLERVYEYLFRIKLIDKNPITSIIVSRVESIGKKFVSGQDSMTIILEDDQKDVIANHVVTLSSSYKWKDRRDAALVCTLLGAGLRLSEALALTPVDAYEKNGELYLKITKGVGLGNQRQVIVQSNLSSCILKWVNENTKSKLLFFGTIGSDESMDPATAYRRIRALLKSVDIAANHEGGRTLRNSYAATLLSTGTPANTVKVILGLRDDKSVRRYQKISTKKI